MKSSLHLLVVTGIAVAMLLCPDISYSRGFGGGRGGGMARGGMARGGMSRGVSRSYSAGVSRGGYRAPSYSARQSGVRSSTGPRGGSITIGGTRGAVRTPGGAAAGRAGGVRVTTPGGRSVTRGGAGAAARTTTGAAAGGLRFGGASGARGAVGGVSGRSAGRNFATDGGFARYSGGVAVRGARGVGVGHRTRAVAVSSRTRSAAAVRGGFGRRHVGYHRWFGPGWYGRHPAAWRARRWTAATVWGVAGWTSLTGFWGWESPPSYYYDYGNTVVYEGDTVYYDSKPVATAEEFYQQAGDIAEQGAVEASDEAEWQSLGVWAMVQGEQTESDKIIQLAVDKKGVIRGNHYDALTETTLPIQGSVDKRTQRAAWTVGENKEVVYETGVYNLTQDETEMLIHFSKDSTQQWSLVRLESTEEETSPE